MMTNPREREPQILPAYFSINCFFCNIDTKISKEIITYLKNFNKILNNSKDKLINVDDRFSTFKDLNRFKQNMQKIIFPFTKAVLSLSEYVIIDTNTIMFYTLEEDGLIDYPEMNEFKYLYKGQHKNLKFKMTFGALRDSIEDQKACVQNIC